MRNFKFNLTNILMKFLEHDKTTHDKIRNKEINIENSVFLHIYRKYRRLSGNFKNFLRKIGRKKL
jgi:ATP-dependent Lon protease